MGIRILFAAFVCQQLGLGEAHTHGHALHLSANSFYPNINCVLGLGLGLDNDVVAGVIADHQHTVSCKQNVFDLGDAAKHLKIVAAYIVNVFWLWNLA